MMTKIKSADILPGDVVKFEFGDYDNWVTVRIDRAEFTNETRQKLVWHYLSDETKSPATCPQSEQGEQGALGAQYTQYICYGDPNEFIDLIERK